MEAGREREAELLAECDDTPADPSGRWSAKDHVVHLSHWRNYAAHVLDAARTGATDTLPAPEEEDVTNAKVYEANKDREAAEVKREAEASWRRLRDAIAACSEEELALPHPRHPAVPVWQTVPGNGHGHLAQHLMFRSLDENDEPRAEEAQVWCHDVDLAAFYDPLPRAYSDYSLACFYARVGRAPEAASLLGESFAAAPELREIAAQDHDLDRIRDAAAFKELFAT